MRKIEQNMISAIIGGYDWKSSNTIVTFDGDDWEPKHVITILNDLLDGEFDWLLED